MSRGGFRGGRGGRPHDPSRPSLNHGSMPFEISPDLVSKADDLKKQDGPWPAMNVPRADPLTALERREVEAYLQLRYRLQMGPYHRRFEPGAGINKAERSKSRSARWNAFLMPKTFQGKREKNRRKIKEARLAGLPWNKELLPQELWGVCGLAEGKQYWPKSPRANSTLTTKEKLDKFNDEDDQDKKATDGEDDVVDDADDADNEDKEKDEDAGSEELDDDFSEDDDDMAADYNAEQYFDDGERDDDDGGGFEGQFGGGGEEW